MKKKLFFSLLIACALLAPQMAKATPANQEVFPITQPSGEVIQLETKGDENFNYVTTEDGTAVNQGTDGYYYYYQHNTSKSTKTDFTLSKAKVGINPPPTAVVSGETLVKANQANNELLIEKTETKTQNLQSKKQNLLVILVDFEDINLTYSDNDWQKLIFGKQKPSLKNYYATETINSLDIEPAGETAGTVNDGIIRVRLDTKHPNTGQKRTIENQKLTKSALEKANQYIDYSQYDSNGNGRIEPNELHFMVVVAGQERSYSISNEPTVWAHRWALNGLRVTLDNTVLDYYTQFGEKHAYRQATVGVIAHEFGHDLGLPDLYNVGEENEKQELIKEGIGLGYTSVMASGSWGARPGEESGTTPVGLDAYSKTLLGMVEETITASTTNKTVQSLTEGSPTILRINSQNPMEYFLIENRQLTGYDEGMKRYDAVFSGGIAIYRINKNYRNNLTKGKQLVTVLEADTEIRGFSLYDRGEVWDADPFYYIGNGVHKQSQATKLTSETTPSTALADSTKENFSVTVKSTTSTKMQLDILINDDHSGDSKDFASLTPLEPGKTIPYVTNYNYDKDYFKTENLSGYYALTLAMDEGLPTDASPLLGMSAVDSSWSTISNRGLSYVSPDNKTYVVFVKFSPKDKTMVSMALFNRKTNVSDSSLLKGMNGTIRIDEIPADIYTLATPIKQYQNVGTVSKIDSVWKIPTRLSHIPFKEIYDYTSTDSNVATFSQNTLTITGIGEAHLNMLATTSNPKVKSEGTLSLSFQRPYTVTGNDDHSGDSKDFASLTPLEPGKIIPYVTNYNYDKDYFKTENLSGYYALTLTMDEGLPTDASPLLEMSAVDSSWSTISNRGLSYVSPDNKTYVVFVKFSPKDKTMVSMALCNRKTNVSDSSLLKGMNGTIRIDEIPADIYTLTTPIDRNQKVGTVLQLDDVWKIPTTLNHIPFKEIYNYKSTNPNIVTVNQNTLTITGVGSASIYLQPTTSNPKIKAEGTMGAPFQKSNFIEAN